MGILLALIYEEGLDNTSPWNDVVNMTMFNNTKKGKYCDLKMEYNMLQKIMTEDLLPKGGCNTPFPK